MIEKRNGHLPTGRYTRPYNMKTNSILTVILAACVLLSVFFCMKQIFQTRDLRSLSMQVQGINNYRAGMQSLLSDCLEYSKKNAAIDPLLQQIGLKPAPTASSKPAGK